MKKNVFLLVLLLCSMLLVGCKSNDYIVGSFAVVYKDDVPFLINKDMETYSLEDYDYIVPEFSDYLVVANYDGDYKKFGFIKNTGEEVIKPVYDEATNFYEGKALVRSGSTLKIINPDNDTLYTFPQGISSSWYFSNDLLVVEKDQKFTYLNKNFELASVSYDYAGSFENGYAVVGMRTDEGLKYGLIDHNFQEVIKPNYDFLDDYHDGYVRVGTIVDKSQNSYVYQFLNLEGDYLKDGSNQVLNYDYALNFSNGYALVANYSTDANYGTFKVYNYVDTNGEYSLTFNYKRLGEGLYYFGNLIDSGNTGTLVTRYRMKVSGAGSWYVLELYDGVLEEIPFVIPEEFENTYSTHYKTPYEMTDFKLSPYYGDSASLTRIRIYTSEYGIVDSTGTYVLPAIYSFIFF